MPAEQSGPSSVEQIAAVIANPVLYELALLVPKQDLRAGGRRRHYPDFAIVLYLALVTTFRSARRVDTELGSAHTWSFVREQVRLQFAHKPEMWLPAQPMRRHHFRAGLKRLRDAGVLDDLVEMFEQRSAEQAMQLGLCRTDGDGSYTHPDLDRTLYGDGKVITPLYKAKRGATRRDRNTGFMVPRRADPDAKLHVTGGGQPAFGNKFLLAAVRGTDAHMRMIVGIDQVEKVGGEAAVAAEVIERAGSRLTGIQAYLYDGALRGKHFNRLLRQLGVAHVVPTRRTTDDDGEDAPGPAVWVETVIVREGTRSRSVPIYAYNGAAGVGELDENGDTVFIPLERTSYARRQNRTGEWRCYGTYRLPDGATVRIRYDNTAEDDLRSFNRAEHLRPIPPSDPDYERLYPRRADIESINRYLDDTLWLGRAHSVGQEAQLLDLLGFALVVNSVALHRHGSAHAPPDRLAA